jgi:hypothetical protein
MNKSINIVLLTLFISAFAYTMENKPYSSEAIKLEEIKKCTMSVSEMIDNLLDETYKEFYMSNDELSDISFMSDSESESVLLFLNEQKQPRILQGPKSGSELISPYHPANNFESKFYIGNSDDTSDEGTDLVEISASDWDSDALEYSYNRASLRELLKNPEYIEMSVNMDTASEKGEKGYMETVIDNARQDLVTASQGIIVIYVLVSVLSLKFLGR